MKYPSEDMKGREAMLRGLSHFEYSKQKRDMSP